MLRMSGLTGEPLAGRRGMCSSVLGAAEYRTHAQKRRGFLAQSTPKLVLLWWGLELSGGYAVILTSTLQTSRHAAAAGSPAPLYQHFPGEVELHFTTGFPTRLANRLPLFDNAQQRNWVFTPKNKLGHYLWGESVGLFGEQL